MKHLFAVAFVLLNSLAAFAQEPASLPEPPDDGLNQSPITFGNIYVNFPHPSPDKPLTQMPGKFSVRIGNRFLKGFTNGQDVYVRADELGGLLGYTAGFEDKRRVLVLKPTVTAETVLPVFWKDAQIGTARTLNGVLRMGVAQFAKGTGQALGYTATTVMIGRTKFVREALQIGESAASLPLDVMCKAFGITLTVSTEKALMTK